MKPRATLDRDRRQRIAVICENKRRGLCGCGLARPLPNCDRCAACKARQAARYQQKVAEGWCVTCTVRRPRPDRTECERCAERSRTRPDAFARFITYSEAKQKGLCTHCKRRKPEPGILVCAICREVRAQAKRDARARAKTKTLPEK